MEGQQQRGRSPSAGHRAAIRHSPSPSPHTVSFHHDLSSLGLDPSYANAPSNFTHPVDEPVANSAQSAFHVSSPFLPQNQQPSVAEHTFLQSQGFPDRLSPGPQYAQGGELLPQDLLDLNQSAQKGGDLDAGYFDGVNTTQNSIDPSFLLDPQLLSSQDQSVDPSNLMNQMATAQSHAPTPPHLLQDMFGPGSSPHGSPSMAQNTFASPGHSRHTSLDPSSAAFPQAQNTDWMSGIGFQTHRRTPSDAYSDVSSSAVPSPYLGNTEQFDPNDNPSPLLSAQQDPSLFQDVLRISQFSLSDNQQSYSPAHSPHISPRLPPQQQSLPQFTPSNNFGLTPAYGMHGNPGIEFPDMVHEPFPQIQQPNGLGLGQADQISTPEISIQFAPPSRVSSFEPQQMESALSPPERSKVPFDRS